MISSSPVPHHQHFFTLPHAAKPNEYNVFSAYDSCLFSYSAFGPLIQCMWRAHSILLSHSLNTFSDNRAKSSKKKRQIATSMYTSQCLWQRGHYQLILSIQWKKIQRCRNNLPINICLDKKKCLPLQKIWAIIINMKKYLAHSLILMSLAILASCSSVKNIPYLQNADEIDLAASRMLYDAKIMPKDMLTIYINTPDPEAGKPFHLYYQRHNGGNNPHIP